MANVTTAKIKVNNLFISELPTGLWCTNNHNKVAKLCVLCSFHKFGYRPSYSYLKKKTQEQQTMHACYSLVKRRQLTDFLTELFKGSSLRLSLAASLVLRDDPVFYAQLRFKRQRKTG